MIGYVALGSNLGDRTANLRAGLEGMARLGLTPESLSSVWETEPVDTSEPPWFLNMVARIRTDKSAIRPDLLRCCSLPRIYGFGPMLDDGMEFRNEMFGDDRYYFVPKKVYDSSCIRARLRWMGKGPYAQSVDDTSDLFIRW